MVYTDVVVIGSGIGGMAAAGLWAKKGYKVHIIESHFAVGGCAGYFDRSEGHYDVGATTITGLSHNKPTLNLLSDLKINVDYKQCDPGITILNGETKISLYADLRKLSSELNQKLQFKHDTYSYLKKLKKIEEVLWSNITLIGGRKLFEFKNIFSLLKIQNLLLLRYPGLFYKSIFDFLPTEYQNNEKFIEILDELLLISTQQKSDTCPAFMGILGFFYPQDTYVCNGGMKGFSRSIENRLREIGVKFNLRNDCKSITKDNDGFIIKTDYKEIHCKKIISNISPLNLKRLYGRDIYKQNKGKVWGALTAYFYFVSKKPVLDLFQQIHNEKKSLFYSFSNPIDIGEGFTKQLVTVSTHTYTDQYSSKNEKYNKIKEDFKTLCLTLFNDHFCDIAIEKVCFDSVSTPLTFKRYTQRSDGEVGGLIHNSILSLNRLAPNIIKNENIYFVGDYSYPGQGIVSVIQSAYNTLK
jgi:phytoene dehydrogenase-like protein